MTASETAQLHSTTVGTSGPRIAFFHGLFGQGKNWTSIAKALAGEYSVTMIDMPNHGRSAWTTDFSFAQMAISVGDLLAAQGSEPVTIVGHSMGGKVAMALALIRPELVERLVVVDIAPVNYAGLTAFSRYVQGMRALDLDQLRDRVAADAGLVPYVDDPVVRGFLLQNLRRDGDGWRWQMNLQLLGDHLDQLGDWPDFSTVAPYRGKVLWVAGQKSNYITDDATDKMHALFPQTRKVSIKNAGHWVHSEQPEVFLSTLRAFLRAG